MLLFAKGGTFAKKGGTFVKKGGTFVKKGGTFVKIPLAPPTKRWNVCQKRWSLFISNIY